MPLLAIVLMNEIKIKEELPLFSIETEMVPPAGDLRLTDIPLSKLVRDHYKSERDKQAQLLKVALKEKFTETQNKMYSANYDAFTGLLSPRLMSVLVEESFQLAKDREQVFTFLYLQVNGLNAVKDQYDDAFVNEVLMTVAKRLKLTIRKKDYLSHLNGNKYLVSLIIEKKRIQLVDNIIEKITKIISKPLIINEIEIVLSINICVVAYPIHGDKLTVLLDLAKMKMYQVNKKKPPVKHHTSRHEHF